MSKPLTAQQSRFVDEYLVDLNGRQAAIRAGYSAKTAASKAAQLLTKVNIQEAIQERMNDRAQRTQIDADFVLHGIAKNIKRCEQAEAVTDREGAPVYVETEDGQLVPAYKYDATNVFKGYELLGKHLKLFTDKVDHSSEDGSMSPKNLSDEQLDAEIRELQKQVGNGQ
jgi:phage terminase small subunit